MKKEDYKTVVFTRFRVFIASVFVLAVTGMGLSGCAGSVGGSTAEVLEAVPDTEQSSETAAAQESQDSGTQTARQNPYQEVPVQVAQHVDCNEAGYIAQNEGQETRQDAGQNGLEVTEPGPVQAPLEVHFLDVGQGDSTLVVCGEDAMLIDAGDNNQGTKIQNYLQNQGVDSLKYVICTHPDEDHIGGMDVIFYKFECETILMTEEDKDTSTYRDVVDTMENRGYQRALPVTGQQYSLGDAVFTIAGPVSMGSDSNNNSIAIVLEHGNQKFLFTGDAEEEEEREIIAEAAVAGISLDVDVYKAGHHGNRNSSSEALLDAASPAYAVISCGEENSYGHPHAETLNQFRSRGIEVFRTDEQGSVVLVCDGNEITWNCSPSDTWQAGEPVGASGGSTVKDQQEPSRASSQSMEEARQESAGDRQEPEEGQQEPGEGQQEPGEGVAQQPPAVTADYICNTNTKKFHYPDCSSVKQMSEKNKLPVNTTREELINQGYVPCKKCNP